MATFSNVAVLSYNGNSTTSNVVTGRLRQVLSAAKTAVSESYGSGDRIAYAVSIVNGGASAFTALSLSDDLGAYEFEGETLYPLEYVEGSVRLFVNGVLQPAPAVSAGPPLVISGVNVPAGGSAIVIYEAQVTEFAPLDTEGTIENTVTVSGCGLSTPITASAVVETESGPVLTITKALDPQVVSENGSLTYTFVIQNSGNTPAEAGDQVVFSDTFDPILSLTSVTFNGDNFPQAGNYTYDETTGQFITVPGRITVPAATFSRGTDGSVIINPGVSILTITGTV